MAASLNQPSHQRLFNPSCLVVVVDDFLLPLEKCWLFEPASGQGQRALPGGGGGTSTISVAGIQEILFILSRINTRQKIIRKVQMVCDVFAFYRI